MVMIRLGGMLFVLGSSVMWGIYMTSKSHFRLKDLREMKRAFAILISEIDYGQSPLSEAAQNIASKCAAPVRDIFKRFGKGLSGKADVYKLWCEAIDSACEVAYFSTEDLEIFKSFGKTLGYLDREMQIRNIDMQMDYISQKIDELEKIKDKSRKMYMSLGCLGGILTIILLI